MRGIKQANSTPAFIVAVAVLVVALGGGAVAGVAVTSLNKKEKNQVKKIARKQAKKQVRKVPAGPRGDAGAPGPAGPKGNQGGAGPRGSDANALQFVSVKDLSGSGTRYLPASGWIEGGEISGPNARSVAAGAFTLRDFTVRLNAAIQFGKTRTFTFQKNGAATAATCTIGLSEARCTSSANVAVAAGDTIQIVSGITGGPSTNDAFIGWRTGSP